MKAKIQLTIRKFMGRFGRIIAVVSLLVLSCICGAIVVCLLAIVDLPFIVMEPPAKEEIEEKPKDEHSSVRVDLKKNFLLSGEVADEMESGRFRVTTLVDAGTDKTALYNTLVKRGGLVVSKDYSGSYHLLDNNGQKAVLKESKITYDGYAFDRPRLIPKDHYDSIFTDTPIRDELFLVMPKSFEAAMLAVIEQTLSRDGFPSYSSAIVTFSLTRAGYLNVTVNELLDNDGNRTAITREFLGL